MKIAWFTPFSKESRIGRYSVEVVAPLGVDHEVDIWYPDDGEARKTELRTIRFADADAVATDALDGYDLLVYNLGNYLPFHREIYRLSRRRPGLVILHDYVMQDFFRQYFIEYRQEPQAYLRAIERCYGPAAREAGEEAQFPLFEEAIRGAYGVVTHSEFLRARVAEVFAGPVAKLHLPCKRIVGLRTLTRAELGVPEESVLLVTVGHVNPNKRVHAVIKALSGMARPLVYAVLGPVEESYQARLRDLARQGGLERVVRLAGYVSDQVLESYLAHADVCVNLRHPTTEGASASALEEMMHGKPLLVSDTGFFAELPDDCVWKIDPQHEPEQLGPALAQLIDDPELRRRMGHRAAEFTEQHCRPELYAQGLLQFALEVKDAVPLLHLADHLAGEFNNLGVRRDMPVVGVVAREAAALFCGE
jgi:glycosyltransferase involved in cell wall biosynthesis